MRAGEEGVAIEEMLGYLRELNSISVCVRILMAAVCGGMIGMERGIKGRAAGFRTHILVCTGAALMTMTGQYIQLYIAPHADPARLGAQVISGIGFLGVGTIITARTRRVRGLTTAAGLWTSACLGLAIGIGFYEAAVMGTFVVLVAMISFQKVDRYFYGKRYIREYCVEIDKVKNIKHIIRRLRKHNFVILETIMEQGKSDYGGDVILLITVKLERNQKPEDFLAAAGEEAGVVFVEEI